MGNARGIYQDLQEAFLAAGYPDEVPNAWNLQTAVAVTGLLGQSLDVRPLRTVTAAVTLTVDDFVVLADATGGAFTVTLLTAASAAGRIFNVKKVDASANAVTVDASGSETIDGELTIPLRYQYENVTVQSDGTNWHIL